MSPPVLLQRAWQTGVRAKAGHRQAVIQKQHVGHAALPQPGQKGQDRRGRQRAEHSTPEQHHVGTENINAA